jgi:hypothetical protein
MKRHGEDSKEVSQVARHRVAKCAHENGCPWDESRIAPEPYKPEISIFYDGPTRMDVHGMKARAP